MQYVRRINTRKFILWHLTGGFDLAARWAGIETKWQVETDNFCNKILEKHFPNAKRYRDIKETTGLERVDIISGGFPCPAFSTQGKRGGFEQDSLFYQFIRVIGRSRPHWIIIENVEGITKWKKQIRNEIESLGYIYEDGIFDARDFGIPQSRRRYFGIGFGKGCVLGSQYIRWIQRKGSKSFYELFSHDKNSEGRGASTPQTKEKWRTIFSNAKRMRSPNGIPNRVDRLKSLGNAIVPQIAYILFEAIKELEKEK